MTAIDWTQPVETIGGVRLRLCEGISAGNPDEDGDRYFEPADGDMTHLLPCHGEWPLIVNVDGRPWWTRFGDPVVRNALNGVVEMPGCAPPVGVGDRSDQMVRDMWADWQSSGFSHG